MLPCKYLTSIGKNSYSPTDANAPFSFNQERTNEFRSLRVPPSVVACGPQPQLDWEEGKGWNVLVCTNVWSCITLAQSPQLLFRNTLPLLPANGIGNDTKIRDNFRCPPCAWRSSAVALMKQVRKKPYRAVIEQHWDATTAFYWFNKDRLGCWPLDS